MEIKEPVSIEHLIHRLEKDDTQAFERLFHQYHKSLYAFARSLLPSTQDAEEIVQNVFMAIWNQRKNLQISSSFLSYLFGIARHLVYDFIRRKIKHEAFVEYYLERNNDYAFITDEELLFNELEGLYKKLVQDLPERRREIFVLSRQEGLSYKEISEKLGISENTVDTQIRNALAYLRVRIAEIQ